MNLIHDIPSSEGVRNGLKRAKQLISARISPAAPLPSVYKLLQKDRSAAYVESYDLPGLPFTGFPYSSVRRTEKYLGYNVSFETYFSALRMPESILYTREISGTGQNVHAVYGIVCSCFVSWVLNFPYRTPCIRIPDVPGVSPVEPGDGFRNLALLDILLDVKAHVALVTGIERDGTGAVRFLTVSESVLPHCRETRFSAEEFQTYWLDRNYAVFRYDRLDRIPYTPSPFVPLPEDPPQKAPVVNNVLLPDYGNKANYRLQDEPVTLLVFKEDFKTVEVCKTDSSEEQCSGSTDGFTVLLPVKDHKALFRAPSAGLYRASAISEDKKSDPVFFCVTDFTLEPEKDRYLPGETVRLSYRNASPDPVIAWQLNQCETDRGKAGGMLEALPGEGTLSLPLPEAEGPFELYLIAKNAFGCYTSCRKIIL